MLAAYQEVLEEIYRSSEDPEQSQYENGPSFALYDADRDGVEELIVRNTVFRQWIVGDIHPVGSQIAGHP